MKFQLIDTIIEQAEDRIVAQKSVTAAEEYLQDHFPTFPVVPGVMMIEALVQAGRRLLADRTGDPRYVLGEVRALRYGSFVRPGEILRVEVKIISEKDGEFKFKGEGRVIRPVDETDEGGSGLYGTLSESSNETAVSGRFTLRPLRSPK